jgi:hypothetical protein
MLDGIPTATHRSAYGFCLRLHHSRVAFACASVHDKMEAFLEGHVGAFAWLGGLMVPHLGLGLSLDGLTLAYT